VGPASALSAKSISRLRFSSSALSFLLCWGAKSQILRRSKMGMGAIDFASNVSSRLTMYRSYREDSQRRLLEAELRKPALDLSDVVRQPCKFNTGIIVGGNGGTVAGICSAAQSGQAPMPHGGAPKARGGLTARARAKQSSMFPARHLRTPFERSSTRFLQLSIVSTKNRTQCSWHTSLPGCRVDVHPHRSSLVVREEFRNY
jgi:hypothetical protein